MSRQHIVLDFRQILSEYQSSEYLLQLVDLGLKEAISVFVTNWLFFQRDWSMDGTHEKHYLTATDQAILILDLMYKPDGAAYVDEETTAAIKKVLTNIWNDATESVVGTIERIEMSDATRSTGRVGRWFGDYLQVTYDIPNGKG